ncbi:MAG: hypothetical protein ACR2KJ_07685 [Jatrophihabitans sp.]
MTTTTQDLRIPIHPGAASEPTRAPADLSWWSRLVRSFRSTGPMTTDPAAVRREAQRLRQEQDRYVTTRALGL